MEGEWFPKSIKGIKMQKIAEWLNNWADFNKHNECLDSTSTIGKDKKPNHITDFGRGYHEAVGDFYRKLGLDFKTFDKRTKSGYSR